MIGGDWEKCAFVFYQPFFTPGSRGVADHGTAGAHHPVAGHDDGDGVAVACPAHCPARALVSHPRGKLLVGYRLPGRNGLQRVPHS